MFLYFFAKRGFIMVFWFIIEHTMLPIFVLVLIGFSLDRKFGIDVKTLSKVMFYLVIPSFIFTKVYSTDFPPGSLSLIANIFIFMIIWLLMVWQKPSIMSLLRSGQHRQ